MTDHPTNGGAKPPTKTRGQERADAIKTPSRLELAERIEQLERELAEARAKGEEHLYNWQRSAADFANFKRRTDEERATVGQFSNALLIGKLLERPRRLRSRPRERPAPTRTTRGSRASSSSSASCDRSSSRRA